ncbi:MAG: hypothetical protein HY270_22015 [Deltaproteobacteria bacterium]|nr:hypothetical protein [Deltaproteobacteria bacterium]
MTARPRQPKRKPTAKIEQPAVVSSSPPSSVLVERLQAYARQPVVRWAVVVLVLAFFAVHGMIAARRNTPTPDEFAYVPEGYYHLRTHDLSFDTTNPPLLKMIMALPLLAMDLQLDTDPRWRDNTKGWGPWIFGTRFMRLNQARYLDAFFAARLVILAIGVGLGVVVFRHAAALLSPLGALVVMVLYGTTPTLKRSIVSRVP